MENDNDMRRIIEALSSSFHQFFGFETITQDLFVPRGHQTKNFFKNMKAVVTVKRTLIYKKWENFCLKMCWNGLSTHEIYIRYVMFACYIEMKFSRNIFDKIINAFALVINFNIETCINSGVYFCDLSVDIFMAFYKRSLKESFYRQGGFQEFSEYLRGHECLPSENYICNGSIIHLSSSFLKDLFINAEKENEKVPYQPDLIKHSDILEDTKCKSLAKEVLSTTKIKLPTLTNSADLNARMQLARKQKMAFYAEVSNRQTIRKPTEGEAMGTDLKRESTTETTKCESLGESVKCESVGESAKCELLDSSAKCKSLDLSAKCKSLVESAKCKSLVESTKCKSLESAKCKSLLESAKCKLLDSSAKCTLLGSSEKCKSLAASAKRETTAAESSKFETTIESSKIKPTAAASSNRETRIAVFSDSEWADPILIQKASEAVTMKNVSKQNSTEAPSKREMMDKFLQQCVHLKSKSQTNIVGENKTQLDWCENIVQRVIKYNDSKRPHPVNENNQIQKEVDELLKRFNNKIKSLIETLEDYDEE